MPPRKQFELSSPRRSPRAGTSNSSSPSVSPGRSSGRQGRFLSPQKKKFLSPQKRKQEAEISKFAHDCVYYMLTADQKKFPVKKQDIQKHVLKGSSKLFPTVKRKATETLSQVYGIEVFEVPDKKDCYILLNRHSHVDLSEFTEKQLVQRGFLYLILIVIYMCEGRVAENDLWKWIKKSYGDIDETKVHPVLGDVKKYLTQELVKQLYLESNRILNSDPLEYEFSWGYRARKEVDIDEMLKFVAEITGTTQEYWQSQYKKSRSSRDSTPSTSTNGIDS